MTEWRGYKISDRVNLESLETALEGLAKRHFSNDEQKAAEKLVELLGENGLLEEGE